MFHDWVILDREMMYEKMKIHILPVKNSSFIHFPDGSKGRKQQIIIPNTRKASFPALVFLNRDDEKHSSTITDVFSHSFHWQYCAMWLNDDWIDPYYFFDYFHIINIFFLFDVQCAVRQQWFLVIYSFFLRLMLSICQSISIVHHAPCTSNQNRDAPEDKHNSFELNECRVDCISPSLRYAQHLSDYMMFVDRWIQWDL